ncbi:MAG: DNA topoisomerase III [Cocleimonas sp.]|nr:DNA topoisomerase III [Cocleimonas sp.]
MLYLCEKPSQARDIAKVLGVHQRHDGYLSGANKIVTWCFGHLLEMAEPHAYGEQYKRWSLASLPIIPQRWEHHTKKGATKQLAIIKRLIKKENHIVIATDADREGEVIAREVMRVAGFKGDVSRLWLSALDDASIRKALKNIRSGKETDTLYYAGVVRSRCDWLVGMNLTRLYSLKAQQSGYQGVLSIGRVQTPTLRMVVDRDLIIKDFIPVPFWNVTATLEAEQQRFKAKWIPPKAADYSDEEGRCIKQAKAQEVHQKIQDKRATVLSATTTRKKQAPPLLFSLSSLQQFCNQVYNMSAKEVLEVAQSLYEKHKVTTYPRTDCEYLPKSQKSDADSILNHLSHQYPALVQQADRHINSRVWNDKKVTAHHAIIPTNTRPNLSTMSEAEKRVHNALCKRYLMQFFASYEFDQTLILLDIETYPFKASGRIERIKGWKVVLDDKGSSKNKDSKTDQQLPSLNKNQQIPVVNALCEDKKTQPPKHYTEGTIIAAMKNAAKEITDTQLKKILKETAGIGTEATRANIIELLIKRKLMTKQKKRLKATEAGIQLIQAVPEAVKSTGTTALWEQSLDGIVEGRVSPKGFLISQQEWLTELIKQEIQSPPLKIKNNDTKGKPTHYCPQCKNALNRRKGKNGFFWGCSTYPTCKFTANDQRGKPELNQI